MGNLISLWLEPRRDWHVRNLRASWLLFRDCRINGEGYLPYWTEWFDDYRRIRELADRRFGGHHGG